MKCTDLLLQDHTVLRRGLDILDSMMKKLEDGQRIEIIDVKAILKFLQVFGDEYHQTVEEKVLFPALVRAVPQGSPIHQMVMEHGEERALAAWIMDALASRRVIDFVYSSRRLSNLLRNHIAKEEAVLAQLAGRLLSEEEDDRIVDEFKKHHKEAETYVNFTRLELKYAVRSDSTRLSFQSELVRKLAAD
jgi:hemerythrin-like domain-containing protein